MGLVLDEYFVRIGGIGGILASYCRCVHTVPQTGDRTRAPGLKKVGESHVLRRTRQWEAEEIALMREE